MTSLSESIRECDSFVGSIFLTRSLLSHPSLMSHRIDDVVRDLRDNTRLSNHAAVTIADSKSRGSPGTTKKGEKGKEDNGDSVPHEFAYRAATCNGRFPLPASALATARNSLLKTAAISHWATARRDPRANLPRRPVELAVQRREVCDCDGDGDGDGTRGAPDDALRKIANSHGRFIYIRNLHARRACSSLYLLARGKARLTTVIRFQYDNVDKNLAKRTARKRVRGDFKEHRR